MEGFYLAFLKHFFERVREELEALITIPKPSYNELAVSWRAHLEKITIRNSLYASATTTATNEWIEIATSVDDNMASISRFQIARIH
jgi:hypothetical protein